MYNMDNRQAVPPLQLQQDNAYPGKGKNVPWENKRTDRTRARNNVSFIDTPRDDQPLLQPQYYSNAPTPIYTPQVYRTQQAAPVKNINAIKIEQVE